MEGRRVEPLPAPHVQTEASTDMASAVVASSDIKQHELELATVAQDYYDSDDPFNYYRHVWGKEHIHCGLYTKLEGEDTKLEGVPRILKASSITTRELLALCFLPGGPAPDTCTLMDMGAGYGGTARAANKAYGCKAVCINISKKQNAVNMAMNKAAGVEDMVTVPGEKSFFDTGMPDASCDVVTSQDALMHAGFERHRAVAEAARVLKPGGRMVFTDYMQTEDASAEDLQEVYDRLTLEDMATVKSYEKWAKDCGLEFVEFIDHTENLEKHYILGIEAHMNSDWKDVGQEFMDGMVKGFRAWKSVAVNGLMHWGFVVLQKPL